MLNKEKYPEGVIRKSGVMCKLSPDVVCGPHYYAAFISPEGKCINFYHSYQEIDLPSFRQWYNLNCAPTRIEDIRRGSIFRTTDGKVYILLDLVECDAQNKYYLNEYYFDCINLESFNHAVISSDEEITLLYCPECHTAD